MKGGKEEEQRVGTSREESMSSMPMYHLPLSRLSLRSRPHLLICVMVPLARLLLQVTPLRALCHLKQSEPSIFSFPVAPDLTSMQAAIAFLVQQPYSLVPEQSLVMPQHVLQSQLTHNAEVQSSYHPWANPTLAQPSEAPVSFYLLHFFHHLLNIVARTMSSFTCHKVPSIICNLGFNKLVMFI